MPDQLRLGVAGHHRVDQAGHPLEQVAGLEPRVGAVLLEQLTDQADIGIDLVLARAVERLGHPRQLGQPLLLAGEAGADRLGAARLQLEADDLVECLVEQRDIGPGGGRAMLVDAERHHHLGAAGEVADQILRGDPDLADHRVAVAMLALALDQGDMDGEVALAALQRAGGVVGDGLPGRQDGALAKVPAHAVVGEHDADRLGKQRLGDRGAVDDHELGMGQRNGHAVMLGDEREGVQPARRQSDLQQEAPVRA